MEQFIPRILVYEAEWADTPSIHDTDTKCFDNVWESSRWVHWVGHQEDRVVFVAEERGSIIGFAACVILTDGLFIDKIGVKPTHRRKGASREIMKMVQVRAMIQEWPHIVSITVPESALLSPGSGNIAGWVRKMGLKARPPFEVDYFTVNGESIAGVPCLLGDE